MKTRALGYLLMVAAAGVYAVGCGSSNNNGGTGGAAGAGTGGRGGAGGAGTGGAGTGGVGVGGKMDAGTDTAKADTGTDTAKADTGTDSPVDVPTDTQTAPTFSDVFAIVSNVTTPATDTAPGCIHCHDGVIADGGMVRLPHSLNLSDKAMAYAQLVGVASQRCAGDGGVGGLMRVQANNAAQSVLWQKLNQGVNPSMQACDGVGMPLNPPTPVDGGTADGSVVDGGFTMTHYAISAAQLATVMGWINAGALND